ncbi:MAG: hypothetical protein JRJ47_02635 [Deltaproteobacteria bacterium]|nr:hypothetical protein [Deltaproteobacteria bacterium]
MPNTHDATDEILHELAEAKGWPARLKKARDSGSHVDDEIREAGERIEALEKRAKETIKRLGCVSPQTRMVSQGMADMLIDWYTFKDSLEP